MSANPLPFQLGPFEVEPAAHRLIGPGGPVALEPKVMAVLLLLAERRGEVVTRGELVDQVWDREYGGDESLTRAVSRLRKALGTQPDGRPWIETIPKRGYRLLAGQPPGLPPPSAAASTVSRRHRLAGLLAAALIVIAAAVLLWVQGEQAREPAPPATLLRPVVAVVPFDYQGADQVDAHLADGLADEVLSALARSQALAVVAGTTSFRYRDERKDLERLREELALTHLVDGNLRRDHQGLRVTVYLIDAASGHVVWSRLMERPDEEIYSIPREVSAAILASLGAGEGTLAARESGARALGPFAAPLPRRAPDPGAYQAFLQARALLRDGTPDNLGRAIRLLRTATERDPSLAAAWAQLALALINVVVVSGEATDYVDPVERSAAARRAAERALSLDTGSLDARMVLAVLDYRERRLSLAGAEARFRELVEEAPGHAGINTRMGMFHGELGQLEASYRRHRTAFDLDRLSGMTACLYSIALFQTGRWSEAHAVVADVNERLAMGFRPMIQFAVLLLDGRFDDARLWVREGRESLRQGGALHLAGDSAGVLDTLLAIIDQLESRGTIDDATAAALDRAMREEGLPPVDALQLYGATGRLEEAWDLIAERLAAGDLYFRSAPFRPGLGGLHAQRRIMELFARSGQLAYWLHSGQWPDFCQRPDLPYDCRSVGQQILAQREPR